MITNKLENLIKIGEDNTEPADTSQLNDEECHKITEELNTLENLTPLEEILNKVIKTKYQLTFRHELRFKYLKFARFHKLLSLEWY